jgi:hypothetical protein
VMNEDGCPVLAVNSLAAVAARASFMPTAVSCGWKHHRPAKEFAFTVRRPT